MRQRLAIVITVVVVLGALIALNAASYVRIEQTSDSEFRPDRSTFNSGATGTRGLYDFLRESGYQVARWRESPAKLLSAGGIKPSTFVIVGEVIRPFAEKETQSLLLWVEQGGRLLIIDRSPERSLLPVSGRWTITNSIEQNPFGDVHADNFEEMTAGVKPMSPAQPTALTRDVELVLPSRFAAAITASRKPEAKPNSGQVSEPDASKKQQQSQPEVSGAASSGEEEENEDAPEAPPPPDQRMGPGVGAGTANGESAQAKRASPAPVAHLSNDRGVLLVDYSLGKGRIVVLADPFIVANNGISRADNLQLAVNLVAASGGLIAFDEFHQGREASQNALISYFAGTPVVAICAQLALIVLVIIWSQGRRFARPLPLQQVDRRSSLEFVASMAELEQRARAHDLALENIYTRTRRVLARYAGSSNSSPRAEIAARVAERSSLNREELELLMRSCEETVNGAPTDARSSLDLARRLREVERALGLRMRAREARQAAEKI